MQDISGFLQIPSCQTVLTNKLLNSNFNANYNFKNIYFISNLLSPKVNLCKKLFKHGALDVGDRSDPRCNRNAVVNKICSSTR